MEKYVEGNMIKDEFVRVLAKYHWFVWMKFFASLIFWGLISFVCAIVGIKLYFSDNKILAKIFLVTATFSFGYIIWMFLGLRLTEMVCTNKRVVCKTGVISVKTAEIKVDKIEAIRIEQTVMGRIFGFGNIIFSGTGTTKVEFCNVSNPGKVKAKIEETLDAEKGAPKVEDGGSD